MLGQNDAGRSGLNNSIEFNYRRDLCGRSGHWLPGINNTRLTGLIEGKVLPACFDTWLV